MSGSFSLENFFARYRAWASENFFGFSPLGFGVLRFFDLDLRFVGFGLMDGNFLWLVSVRMLGDVVGVAVVSCLSIVT